jgi:hypothetical protein
VIRFQTIEAKKNPNDSMPCSIIKEFQMKKQSMHPGQLLKTTFIDPEKISTKTLAKQLIGTSMILCFSSTHSCMSLNLSENIIKS